MLYCAWSKGSLQTTRGSNVSNVQRLHLLMSNWLVSNLTVTRQVAYLKIFSISMKYFQFLIVNQALQFSPSVLSEIASWQEERHNKNTSHPDRQTDRHMGKRIASHPSDGNRSERTVFSYIEGGNWETDRPQTGGMEWRGGFNVKNFSRRTLHNQPYSDTCKCKECKELNM